MGTVLFLVVKQPGHGINHPLLSSAKFKERVAVPLLPSWAFMASARVNLTLALELIPHETCRRDDLNFRI
jgi:hypothetical protein